MCGVIRVICVIRLIRDSDTVGGGPVSPLASSDEHGGIAPTFLVSYLLYLRTGTGACPYTQIVFEQAIARCTPLVPFVPFVPFVANLHLPSCLSPLAFMPLTQYTLLALGVRP